MRGGGGEKEAAVPLGVSLCPGRDWGIMPTMPSARPITQATTAARRPLDGWLAGPKSGAPLVFQLGTRGTALPFAQHSGGG